MKVIERNMDEYFYSTGRCFSRMKKNSEGIKKLLTIIKSKCLGGKLEANVWWENHEVNRQIEIFATQVKV